MSNKEGILHRFCPIAVGGERNALRMFRSLMLLLLDKDRGS